jgi:hypothetical protein
MLVVDVTPPTTTTRLGGVTTLQDNNKTKAIENIGINLKDRVSGSNCQHLI